MDTVELRDLVPGTRVWVPSAEKVWAAAEVTALLHDTNRVRVTLHAEGVEERARLVDGRADGARGKALEELVIDLGKTPVFLRNEAVLFRAAEEAAGSNGARAKAAAAAGPSLPSSCARRVFGRQAPKSPEKPAVGFEVRAEENSLAVFVERAGTLSGPFCLKSADAQIPSNRHMKSKANSAMTCAREYQYSGGSQNPVSRHLLRALVLDLLVLSRIALATNSLFTQNRNGPKGYLNVTQDSLLQRKRNSQPAGARSGWRRA